MEKILDNIMCSTIEDEARFADVINKWIADEEVPEFEAFTKESKSTKKKRRKQVFICLLYFYNFILKQIPLFLLFSLDHLVFSPSLFVSIQQFMLYIFKI